MTGQPAEAPTVEAPDAGPLAGADRGVAGSDPTSTVSEGAPGQRGPT